jgi:HSP20 family protein
MSAQELQAQEKQEVTNAEYMRPGRTYVPQVDIYENPKSLWLWVDMPGVTEQNIDVHVNKNVLSIEGQVAVAEYAELTPLYTEYNIGNDARQFTLSDTIDTEKIAARMHDGVLELELPKAEHAQPRRIQVTLQ